jgi:class 3 adenylate cyclase
LVVDDTPANLSLLHSMLKDTYRVKLANSGTKALELAEASPPDMVLLDIMMPDMDGYEVIRRLKANEATMFVPVIFLTAKIATDDEELGFSLGAVDFIHKPISPPIVAARIKTHLEIKSLSDFLRIRNQFIKKTFGRYMSDEVVEVVLESPDGLKLGGESKEVSIVMSDLRGFSAISEKLSPEKVVEMLNIYLSSMTEIIFKYSGTINDIIGDGLLIIFGAPIMRPDDADRALACALEMQLAVERINLRNKEFHLPELEMGIGVNTGNVVVGNIGSDMRLKYAVVGNNVNLTARVESFTVGGQVLITESTLKAITLDVTIKGELSISFKGMDEPVKVYDITDVKGNYVVSLPKSENSFFALQDEIPILFEILDGKSSSGEKVRGKITKLAKKSAIFYSETELANLINLKFNLHVDFSVSTGGVVYAKVIKRIPDNPNYYEMRFTFLPQEVRSCFDNILASMTIGQT